MTGWAIASSIGDDRGSSLSALPFSGDDGGSVDPNLWQFEDGTQFEWEDGPNAEFE